MSKLTQKLVDACSSCVSPGWTSWTAWIGKNKVNKWFLDQGCSTDNVQPRTSWRHRSRWYLCSPTATNWKWKGSLYRDWFGIKSQQDYLNPAHEAHVARWYTGMPSACYAADPGLNLSEGWYGSVGWQTMQRQYCRLYHMLSEIWAVL